MMSFVGRTPELGAIRGFLDRSEASLLTVHGMRGVGKSTLVARAVAGMRVRWGRCPAAPESAQLAHLARVFSGDTTGDTTEGTTGGPGEGLGAPPSPVRDWAALLDAVLASTEPGSAPTVLVLDDAHHLDGARARIGAPLADALRRARAEGRLVHVVAVSHEPLHFVEALSDGFHEGPLEVGPLPFRAARPLLPGATAVDQLRAYAIFGGIPRALAQVDPTASLTANVRRCFLESEAPLGDALAGWLERDVQNPMRYHAILAALSHGDADWGRVHDAVPDVGRSGQLAPYVHRLRELGLARVRRSLDAPPRSRSRRYAPADPLLAFWYGTIRPVLASRTPTGGPDDRRRANAEWQTLVRPQVDRHTARVFPLVCRQFMRYDAMEVFGTGGREVGSLWGAGYDIPVAGILRSGAAFYGVCFWDPVRVRDAPLEALDTQIRETRYGFGRERRLRLLFSRHRPPHRLAREVFRREDAWLLGPDELAGTGAR